MRIIDLIRLLNNLGITSVTIYKVPITMNLVGGQPPVPAHWVHLPMIVDIYNYYIEYKEKV